MDDKTCSDKARKVVQGHRICVSERATALCYFCDNCQVLRVSVSKADKVSLPSEAAARVRGAGAASSSWLCTITGHFFLVYISGLRINMLCDIGAMCNMKQF